MKLNILKVQIPHWLFMFYLRKNKCLIWVGFWSFSRSRGRQPCSGWGKRKCNPRFASNKKRWLQSFWSEHPAARSALLGGPSLLHVTGFPVCFYVLEQSCCHVVQQTVLHPVSLWLCLLSLDQTQTDSQMTPNVNSVGFFHPPEYI